MLNNVKGKYKDAYTEIANIITTTGTRIGDEANRVVESWKKAADAIKTAVNAASNPSSITRQNVDTAATAKGTGLGTAIDTNLKSGGTSASNLNNGKNVANSTTKTETEISNYKFTVTPKQKTVTATADQIKKGITTGVTVKAKGATVSSSNYTVTYSNNKAVGTARISVSGKGNYAQWSGTATFSIKKKTEAAKKTTTKTTATTATKKNTKEITPTIGSMSVGGTTTLGKTTTSSATTKTTTTPVLAKNVVTLDSSKTGTGTFVNTLKTVALTKIKNLIAKFTKPSKAISATDQKKKSALWQYVYKKSGRSATDANLVTLWNNVMDKKVTASRLTDAQKNELLKKIKAVGYKKGVLSLNKEELNWTHEGEIIRRSDGAILRQLPAGTQVVPQLQSENLMKWAQTNPSKFMNNMPTINSVTNNKSGDINVNSPLIVVNGNADANTVKDLNNLAYDLIHNREFMQGITSGVNKANRKEAGKIGIR